MTILDAFDLHNTHGFTLDVAMDAAATQGTSINLAAFACDALGAGWPIERVRATITSAAPHVVWPDFLHKLAQLHTLAGSPQDPEAWTKMKNLIQSYER